MQPIIKYFTNISRKKLAIRLMLFLILLLVFVFSSFFAWDYFINQKVVTLNPSSGTTITIGTQKGDEPVIIKEIASTNVIKKIRLYPGVYVIKFSSSKDYQEEVKSVSIDKSIEIKTPTLSYTDAKLSQLLINEKPEIQKSLLPSLPEPGYKIDSESLLETGQWYIAKIIPANYYLNVPGFPPSPNSQVTQSMLKIILKKEGTNWKIAAGPAIIIAIADYPNIPQDVIRATNKLGFD